MCSCFLSFLPLYRLCNLCPLCIFLSLPWKSFCISTWKHSLCFLFWWLHSILFIELVPSWWTLKSFSTLLLLQTILQRRLLNACTGVYLSVRSVPRSEICVCVCQWPRGAVENHCLRTHCISYQWLKTVSTRITSMLKVQISGELESQRMGPRNIISNFALISPTYVPLIWEIQLCRFEVNKW